MSEAPPGSSSFPKRPGSDPRDNSDPRPSIVSRVRERPSAGRSPQQSSVSPSPISRQSRTEPSVVSDELPVEVSAAMSSVVLELPEVVPTGAAVEQVSLLVAAASVAELLRASPPGTAPTVGPQANLAWQRGSTHPGHSQSRSSHRNATVARVRAPGDLRSAGEPAAARTKGAQTGNGLAPVTVL